MRDLGQNWPSMADWDRTEIRTAHLCVRPVTGLSQYLVSGALTVFARKAGFAGEGVGALGVARGERYPVRLARDRMLVVGPAALNLDSGWNDEGFGVSDVSAAFTVFDIEGRETSRLLGEATSLDPAKPGPSAAVVFAGLPAMLYRHETVTGLRLHVERGLAMAAWCWLEDFARACADGD